MEPDLTPRAAFRSDDVGRNHGAARGMRSAHDLAAARRHTFVQEPARRANRPVPELEVLKSPYRFIINPVVDRILELEAENPDRMIAVMLPELVERHWMHYFLHNQRPEMIAVRLMRKGKQRIMIVNVPWHMPD